MIQFSDNPEKAIEAVRIGVIRQLQESNILKLEDYEDLFRCEITGLDVPTKFASKKEVDTFRRQLKATLIQTSATEFSFYEVSKIFHETRASRVFEFAPYKNYKNTRIADIPQGVKDKDGNYIYETLIKNSGIKKKDLLPKNLLFTEPVLRTNIRDKSIIDTNTIRDDIAQTYVRNNPEKMLYREVLDIGFNSIHNTYHNRFTRQLAYESNTIRKVKNDAILQFIRYSPDLTYEAVGKIFGRTRMQIRDLARDNGIYRMDKGNNRDGVQVEMESWTERKKVNQSMKEPELER